MSDRRIKCLWRTVLLSVLTAFAALLSTGCLATDQGVKRNTNEGVQAGADLPSGGDIIEIDSYEFADEYSGNLIEEISPKLGLTPLEKTAAGHEEFVFRLWTNLGGLEDAKLLMIRLSGIENRAQYFGIHNNPGPIRFQKESPASPKSGLEQNVV